MCDCNCDCTNAFCDQSNPSDKKCKAHGSDAGGSPSGGSLKCTGYGCAPGKKSITTIVNRDDSPLALYDR